MVLSKKLSAKMSRHQKFFFSKLFKLFNNADVMTARSKTFAPTKKEIEIIAHNLALMATWELSSSSKQVCKKIGKCAIDSGTLVVADPSYLEKGLDYPNIAKSTECREHIFKGVGGKGIVATGFGGDVGCEVVGVYEGALLKQVIIDFKN